MISRENSLKTRYNFNLVLKRGREFSSPSLIIKYIKTGFPKRFGVITSSRFSKKAVVQNMARRAILRAIQERIDKFPENHYYVVIPKKTILKKGQNDRISVDVKEISSEIDTFLSKMVIS